MTTITINLWEIGLDLTALAIFVLAGLKDKAGCTWHYWAIAAMLMLHSLLVAML